MKPHRGIGRRHRPNKVVRENGIWWDKLQDFLCRGNPSFPLFAGQIATMITPPKVGVERIVLDDGQDFCIAAKIRGCHHARFVVFDHFASLQIVAAVLDADNNKRMQISSTF